MKFILSLILCYILAFHTAQGSERFQQISVNEGLAHSDANCIVQDSSGLIWIGTSAGLQSYDGYALQIYDYYPEGNRYFQSHNRILSMACTNNRIWIGTDSGLTCFDPYKCCYIPYQWEKENDQWLSYTPIKSLFVNPSGQFLWIGTQRGMRAFRLEQNDLKPATDSSGNKLKTLTGVRNIQFQGNMAWIATYNNLYLMELTEKSVHLKRTYNVKELLHTEESINNIFCLVQYLFIRTSKGCYRFPVTDGNLQIPTSQYVEFHALDSRIPPTQGDIL